MRIIVMTLVGLLATVASAPAQTAPPEPERHNFGMVGITRGEIARLNISYVAPPEPDVPPGPCRVAFMFFDSSGRRIAGAILEIAPGQSRHLDVGFMRAPPPDQDRQEVRAGWQAPPDPDAPQCTSDRFIANVEVIGRDGETSVLYPGLQAPPEPETPGGVSPPEPDHNFGIVGVARGQTARLNVAFAQPPDPIFPLGPCRVQLTFFDANGARLATTSVVLLPGQARALDFVNTRRAPGGRPGEAAPPDPERVQVRANWIAPPEPERPQCTSNRFIATVEVVGRGGSTTVLYPGLQPPPEPDRLAGR